MTAPSHAPSTDAALCEPKLPNPERDQTDESLRLERAKADDAVAKPSSARKATHEERAERAALLWIEREKTDDDLCLERARSDDAVATRDEFLGIVSHDLRNMLNAIVGFAALITKEVSRDGHVADVVAHAGRIQRAGARMNRLVGDLVDIASIEAGALAVHREIGDATQVVIEAAEAFHGQASTSGISLTVEIAEPSAVVAFDPARILQVVTNLLSNALKFTPSGGSVVARAELIGDDMRFSVRDTGAGIPSDKLEAVFERFVQVDKNDRRGVGLGLFISKCIVQGHGGRMWAESGLGKGSTFFFTLPIHVAA